MFLQTVCEGTEANNDIISAVINVLKTTVSYNSKNVLVLFVSLMEI